MTNFSAKILNNSVGALSAQQAVIANTANNIANVNTPGYTRRVVDLQTRVSRGNGSGIDVGNGVEVGRILRVTDAFLERQLRAAQADRGSATIQNEFLGRMQELFSLTGERQTIGTTMNGFFSAVNDLAANPSNIELRSIVISRANDLVNSIQTTYSGIANLQTEADRRIQSEIQNVNSITSQIAELNARISSAEGASGSVAGDERDRREVLLQQLSEKLNVSIVDQDDGSVLISLSNGFPIVAGATSRPLATTTSPSFAGAMPPSLDGGILSHIVYDYDPSSGGESHIDLTRSITGGTIGGLLELRGYNATTNTTPFQADGILVETASRIEALARSLLTEFNDTYLGPDRDAGTAGRQPSSGDLDGNVPSNPFAFFRAQGLTDADGDGVPETSDLNASGIHSFANILSVTITDPRRIAAARDTSGGAPAAATFPPGDGRNMEALGGLQSTSRTLTLGSYTYTGTYEGAYSETVTKVGNDKARAEVAAKVAEGTYEAALSRRDEVSGVSLDEEFTNLIKFQKAYQAAARMLKVGGELLDEILQAL